MLIMFTMPIMFIMFIKLHIVYSVYEVKVREQKKGKFWNKRKLESIKGLHFLMGAKPKFCFRVELQDRTEARQEKKTAEFISPVMTLL